MMKKLILCLVLSIGLFTVSLSGNDLSNVKPEVLDDASMFIDLNKCNQLDEKTYSVCWNNTLNAPDAGWTIIDGNNIGLSNIKKRPVFFDDHRVQLAYNHKSIQLPNHNGHTFANDSDNDYSNETLHSTYNMINITPMHESLNIGAWRKIENRGKILAKQAGEVTSITLVEYFDSPKYNMLYPKAYTRIYLTEDISECYKADNLDRKSSSLQSYKIDCKKLLRK